MHDQNFKNLILDYPVQSLEFFANEEAGMDLTQARIIPLRQEQKKPKAERFQSFALFGRERRRNNGTGKCT